MAWSWSFPRLPSQLPGIWDVTNWVVSLKVDVEDEPRVDFHLRISAKGTTKGATQQQELTVVRLDEGTNDMFYEPDVTRISRDDVWRITFKQRGRALGDEYRCKVMFNNKTGRVRQGTFVII